MDAMCSLALRQNNQTGGPPGQIRKRLEENDELTNITT